MILHFIRLSLMNSNSPIGNVVNLLTISLATESPILDIQHPNNVCLRYKLFTQSDAWAQGSRTRYAFKNRHLPTTPCLKRHKTRIILELTVVLFAQHDACMLFRAPSWLNQEELGSGRTLFFCLRQQRTFTRNTRCCHTDSAGGDW
jgi:hypothetical protein